MIESEEVVWQSARLRLTWNGLRYHLYSKGSAFMCPIPIDEAGGLAWQLTQPREAAPGFQSKEQVKA